MVADYGTHVKDARDAFRLGESELASRSFRFPDKIAKLVSKAVESLSEFGRLVNGGLFDKADLQFVKFRDDYGQITKVGRGWHLADPLEGIKRYFRKKKQDAAKHRYDLTESEMDAILELVHKRATSQAHDTFAVHPPKKLLDRPEIAQSETAIEELDQSVFVVAFQDGTSKKMSFVELMVFTFNLIVLAQQHHDVAHMMMAVPKAPRDIKVSVRFSIDEIMRPEMVRLLLSKISFSNAASDGEQPEHGCIRTARALAQPWRRRLGRPRTARVIAEPKMRIFSSCGAEKMKVACRFPAFLNPVRRFVRINLS